MDNITLAIVGAGQIGDKHAQAIASSTSGRLLAMCDSDQSREHIARAHGVDFHIDLAQMLSEASPDGVIVSTSTQSHVEVAKQCIEAGLPCLVEKPIAVTAADARALVNAADARGVPLMVGHHRRHNPVVEQARAVVQGGQLGDLVGVNAIWALRKHDTYYDAPWRTQIGAGPVLTNLIHDVDSLRYICGEVTGVMAMTSSAVRGHNVEDTASLTLRFANGALGTVLISDAASSPWAWEVNSGENLDYPQTPQNSYFFAGTKAALAFPRLDLFRYVDPDAPHWLGAMQSEPVNVGAKSTDDGAPASPLVAQIDHFARVIRGQEAPKVSGREGARTLACIEAVFESARLGALVVPDMTGF